MIKEMCFLNQLGLNTIQIVHIETPQTPCLFFYELHISYEGFIRVQSYFNYKYYKWREKINLIDMNVIS